MRFCSVAVLTALLLASPERAQATSKGKVAILDFVITGVEKTQADKLNDALAGNVAIEVQALGYEVVTTADVRAMLGFERQKALLGCESDTSCIAEIGGALGVDLLLTGTIGKLGGNYEVTLTLLASDRAEIRGRFSGTAGTESALPITVARGTGVVFGAQRDVGRTGVLLVKTEPSGADILVDGRRVGTSPVDVELAAGEHEIRAERGDLVGTLRVTIAGGQVSRQTLLLATPPVKLRIFSDPPEATVSIDGAAVGTTPLVLDELPSGRHTVRVEAEGYAFNETTLELNAADFEQRGREPFRHEVKLRPVLPVTPGVAFGLVADPLRGDDVGESVAFHVEATAGFGRHIEIGLGFAAPGAFLGALRAFVLRDGFELGAFARGVAFGRRAPAAPDDLQPGTGLALGAGVSIGFGVETGAGIFGARVEGGPHVDVSATGDRDELALTIPVSVATAWRFE